jgi:hypothetical protein
VSQEPAKTGLTVGDLMGDAQALGRDRFVSRFAHAALIQMGVLGVMRDESTGFKTLEEPATGNSTPTDMRVMPEARVWFVQKTQLTFPDKISVGRSRNNDITIPDANVSKLHAYLTPSGDGFSLVDADSSNGTFVDSRKIEPLTPFAVGDGQVLQFGPTARAMLCTPDSLCTLLTSGLVK